MPAASTFHRAIRSVCDDVLLRAIALAESALPEISVRLGHGLANELRANNHSQPIITSPLLTFTHNEPAINLYTAGGEFAAHRDLQMLTVLIALTDAESCEGGGPSGSWDPPSEM